MPGDIYLKQPTLDDLEFIRWLWADPETMAPVGGPIILEDFEALEWYTRMISPGSMGDHYRLIFDQENTPVGEVSFHRLDPETMTADLNIKIGAKYQGNGYAKEALRQFLAYFFNDFGARLIQDRVAKINPIGKKYLLDFGFIEAGSYADADLLQLSRNRFNDRYRSLSR